MSIKRIEKEQNSLESRRTVIVTQSFRGAVNGSFVVNLDQYQIGFIPTRMVLRQLAYVNTIDPATNFLGTDQGIFVLWCSASKAPIAFINSGPLGIVATTEQVINLYLYSPILEFNLLVTSSSVDAVTVGNVTTNALLTVPTGFLALSIELF